MLKFLSEYNDDDNDNETLSLVIVAASFFLDIVQKNSQTTAKTLPPPRLSSV